jgi:AraC-like DNA-binding protein
MEYSTDFLSVFQANIMSSSNFLIQNHMPKPLSPPRFAMNNLPFVQAYGNIHSTYPYYYETSGIDSYCLIYTETGTGTLILNNRYYSIIPNTLALIDCNILHKLKINQSPWNYKVFFMNGTSLAFLYRSLTDKSENLYTLPMGSDLPNLIQKLYSQLDKKSDSYFLHAKLISDILYDMLLEKKRLEERDTLLPDYLSEIKRNFDVNYHDCFTLDSLEQQYHISKYRLCREFTKQLGISPIQYINRRRIEVAKETLRDTDKRINEVGRMVGIDNTNHFIRLFKQQTGVTPLIFRKQPPVATTIS